MCTFRWDAFWGHINPLDINNFKWRNPLTRNNFGFQEFILSILSDVEKSLNSAMKLHLQMYISKQN